jgi:hypothetical protein
MRFRFTSLCPSATFRRGARNLIWSRAEPPSEPSPPAGPPAAGSGREAGREAHDRRSGRAGAFVARPSLRSSESPDGAGSAWTGCCGETQHCRSAILVRIASHLARPAEDPSTSQVLWAPRIDGQSSRRVGLSRGAPPSTKTEGRGPGPRPPARHHATIRNRISRPLCNPASLQVVEGKGFVEAGRIFCRISVARLCRTRPTAACPRHQAPPD